MRQTWTRVLVVASLAVVGALATPSAPALARDRVVTASPTKDTTLDAAPRQIALTFTGRPQQSGSSITVIGPDGGDATDGDIRFQDTSMTVGFDATTTGEYTVMWEAVSSDGDPIAGAYTFILTSTRAPLGKPQGGSSGATEPSPGEDAGSGGQAKRPTAGAQQESGAESLLRELPLTIWLVVGSGVLLLGALIVLSILGRRQMRTSGSGGSPNPM